MHSLKLIQIGDVHFPDALKRAALVDYKDRAMSGGFIAPIAANALEQLTREVRNLRSRGEAAAILFCGDLTTKGDMRAYSQCVEYLHRVLEIGDPVVWPNDEIHVVLGNHDVDREKVTFDGTDLLAKFTTARDAWANYRAGVLTVDGPRTTNVTRGPVSASITSVNSCLGCGEWRSRLMPLTVPDPLRDELKKYLEDPKHTADAFQRLDTPAFREQDISTIVTHVNGLPDSSAAIVLTHHNILPQALPRIDLYTEVINGGMARSRFAACKHPVIYLHGHIHLDPIESVTLPSQSDESSGRLISISAPEFSDGFNVIEIHFGRHKIPIGVTVHALRLASGGGVFERLPAVRLPLYDLRDATDQNLADDVVQKVVGALPSDGRTWVRFSEVTANVRGHQADTIAAALLEGEWLGLLRIRNRERANRTWQIARVAP